MDVTPQQINEFIETIKKLFVTMYEIFRRQVAIDAINNSLLVLFLLVLTIIFYMMSKNFIKKMETNGKFTVEDRWESWKLVKEFNFGIITIHETTDAEITKNILVAAFFICIVAFILITMLVIPNLITAVFNPDYLVIQKVIGYIK